MKRQFVHAERADVGIHSIEQHPDKRNAVVKIDNIGKLPADRVTATVHMILLIPDDLVRKHPNDLKPV